MPHPDSEACELARAVVHRADELGVRFAAAESLTGGLLSATIVSVPGASRVFSGGIVAYDTALKSSLLGVDAPLLAARGPVDPEVATQMARGVRRACAVPQGRAGEPWRLISEFRRRDWPGLTLTRRRAKVSAPYGWASVPGGGSVPPS